MGHEQTPDTERLDKLQRLTTGYGLGWILRLSGSGRGTRLHESYTAGATRDIRQAIDNFNESAPVANIASVVFGAELQDRLITAEELCRLVEEQLVGWDVLYPDRKDDSADNQAIRAAVAKWKETLL